VQQAWQLVSECLPVKYSCLLALPVLLAVRNRQQVLLVSWRLRQNLQAMAAHSSQWVW
jgi:hypothetical protein